MTKKQKVKRRASTQPKAPTTLRQRWERFSFSEKVMAFLSVFIVLSMVLAAVGQIATGHG